MTVKFKMDACPNCIPFSTNGGFTHSSRSLRISKLLNKLQCPTSVVPEQMSRLSIPLPATPTNQLSCGEPTPKPSLQLKPCACVVLPLLTSSSHSNSDSVCLCPCSHLNSVCSVLAHPIHHTLQLSLRVSIRPLTSACAPE